jgi:hypothetical protein
LEKQAGLDPNLDKDNDVDIEMVDDDTGEGGFDRAFEEIPDEALMSFEMGMVVEAH